MSDIRRLKTLCVAALTPVDVRAFMRNEVKACFSVAGDVVVEVAPADEADPCLPGAFEPMTSTDVCGDETSADVVLSVLAEDIADGGSCCFTLKPCGFAFIRFSADAAVGGFEKSIRPAVNYGCGPTIVGS